MDSWQVFLEGLEFLTCPDEPIEPGHCAHVIQCPNGHYAVLRTPAKVNPRELQGSLYCPRCKREWPVPKPG